MGNVVLYISMSLDGFVAGPNDDLENPLGQGGERLHEWLSGGEDAARSPGSSRPPGRSAEVLDELLATGAVLAGRRTYDLVRGWDGSHHGVPVFVLTHRVPDEDPSGDSEFTFVTAGVESAVRWAKAAAGDKDVLLHGADIAQQCLRAGLLDEMRIHLVPVLLGSGRRMFDRLGAGRIELETTGVIEAPGVTHLSYRIVG